MASIEKSISGAITTNKRGSIFFPIDFCKYGEYKAAGKVLERLTASKQIIRLARGIY